MAITLQDYFDWRRSVVMKHLDEYYDGLIQKYEMRHGMRKNYAIYHSSDRNKRKSVLFPDNTVLSLRYMPNSDLISDDCLAICEWCGAPMVIDKDGYAHCSNNCLESDGYYEHD